MSDEAFRDMLNPYHSLDQGWLAETASPSTCLTTSVRDITCTDSPWDVVVAAPQRLVSNATSDAEAEMDADSGGSGGYLLSTSRMTSNSSEFTDSTSAADSSSSSSDSSDLEEGDADGYVTYRGGEAGSADATVTSGADGIVRLPLAPPSSPSLVPRARAASQPVVAKGKHGLRATRSRLSIQALPNLLKEKTDELDLDYREINVNELDLDEQPVGRGAFGTIYKGQWRGARVAIKKLNVLSMTEKELYEFRHEVALMKSLCNHPNIVDFIGACTTPPHFCLVTKYYANGSVKDYLERHKDVPWITRVRFARDAAAGVLHLHCEHVVHRDLAARNALVDDNLNVRVCDFGLARRLTTQAQESTSTLLPVPYMAPESIRKQEYSIKSDSFSFGVFLWELVTRQKPYAGMPLLDVAFGVTIEGLRLKIPDDCHEVFRQLMTKCWETEPADRPDFYELFLTLEGYLEQLEIEEAFEKERRRKEELARKMERASDPSVTAYLMPHGIPRTGSGGRTPIRIRSTPMMSKAALGSPFMGFGAGLPLPLDRSAAEIHNSSRMARSETMLLSSKNTDKQVHAQIQSAQPPQHDKMQRAGSADAVKDSGMESGEHALKETDFEGSGAPELGHRVRRGLDGRELVLGDLERTNSTGLATPTSGRRRVAMADRDDMLRRSAELLTRLSSKDHVIDPARIIAQFPFENGTHGLICKAKLVLPASGGEQKPEKTVAVAIKRLSNFLLHTSERGTHEDLMRQVELMLAVRDCPNVVRFLGANLALDNGFLVYQWVKHGSLAQLMYGLGRRWKKLRKQKPLLLVRMAHDVAKAMGALHEKGIAHCNLEPKNILLDEKYRALVCGFSLARFVDRPEASEPTTAKETQCFHQPQSSILFSAPEVWNVHLRTEGGEDGGEAFATQPSSQEAHYASDVYSFGMIMWTLWHGFSHEELKKRRKLVRKVLASRERQRRQHEGAEEDEMAANEGDTEEDSRHGDEAVDSATTLEREAKEAADSRLRALVNSDDEATVLQKMKARDKDEVGNEAKSSRRPRTGSRGEGGRNPGVSDEGAQQDLREFMLADLMPPDWLSLTEACLSFQPEERPSFDVILPTLRNIWKNWKDALETHGDISQASMERTASVSFPDASITLSAPFGRKTSSKKTTKPAETTVLPRRDTRHEASPSDDGQGSGDEEEEGSLSRLSSSAQLSVPSSPFDSVSTIYQSEAPASLQDLRSSFTLSPQMLPSTLPPMTLQRSAQSSPAFSHTTRRARVPASSGLFDAGSRTIPRVNEEELEDEEEDEDEERVAEAARRAEQEPEREGEGAEGMNDSDTLEHFYEEDSVLMAVASADLRREL